MRNNPKPKLRYCPNCKEDSVTTRVYQKVKRVEFCVNRGCRYVKPLPNLRKPEEEVVI